MRPHMYTHKISNFQANQAIGGKKYKSYFICESGLMYAYKASTEKSVVCVLHVIFKQIKKLGEKQTERQKSPLYKANI